MNGRVDCLPKFDNGTKDKRFSILYKSVLVEIKNHTIIVRMIWTNLLVIPALAEALSVSSFRMNLILGRI